MDSENNPRPYEDNRDVEQSRQSLRSTSKDSEVSFRSRKRDKSRDADEKGDRARTRLRDPDRDRMSDSERRRSDGSFYSEDGSPSERSLSPYSRTPSPSPPRGVGAKRVSGSPLHKTGVRRVAPRPQRAGAQAHQRQRCGVRSQGKESTPVAPPKDLDLVTKRMLSARLLKINELRNGLAELQLRTDELQKENRLLRQLQVRQEKALQRYDDTESEIAQLISRHSNETHALRERLRRGQERERAQERGLKEAQEQLQRSQAALGRLRKLAEERELGPRDELSRRLDQETARVLEYERKIKDLERGMELSSSSYQRQLATERKKSTAAQEEVRALRQEMEQLGNKLKEKERELDTRNIYANRMLKPSPRKDTDNGTKTKAPSRNSTKAVQTEGRKSSLDFPSPPPAITNGNEYSEQPPDDFLSLKELGEASRRPRGTDEKEREREQQRRSDGERERELELEKEREKEKEEKNKIGRELNMLEEKARRLRDGWEKEDEARKRRTQKEEENRKRRGLVQEEDERRNQEALASQEAAEKERRRKEQILAKMREIDQENQPPQGLFSDADPPESEEGAGRLLGGAGSREGGRRGGGGGGGTEGGVLTMTGAGRRPARAQASNDDLSFGSYAPSFGRPAPRGAGFPPSPPKEEISFGGSEKERGGLWEEKKSNLMQQFFGAPSSSSSSCSPPSDAPGKRELLASPASSTAGRGRREGLFTFDPEPPASLLSTLHVAESRPAVRAIASFDDDIEELTL